MFDLKQKSKPKAPEKVFPVGEKELPAFEEAVAEHSSKIEYSGKYHDDHFEYRHVILPDEIARYLPKEDLLREEDVRRFGVIQSPGWEHFMIHILTVAS
ncbi:Cks1bp, variant 3 [Entomophthora muscae]|uniref:Cks1bp, variant 3 n=1 Tax=Entomophthora muscae TaxID=34485 RepID=A0ACC2UQZ1_9FUNG|nr:Cks1bp, variant 3 [Entomophthora muscae]